MNSTMQPVGQKQTGRLNADRLANTMPADLHKKRGATATTSKAVGMILPLIINVRFIGLNEDMINAIGDDEELQYLIKLHSSV